MLFPANLLASTEKTTNQKPEETKHKNIQQT